MTLEWLGKYRELVGIIYRSANAYSSVAKKEILGDQVHFTPYEVQIMEYIMENEDDYKNMTWYASKMGLSTSTYSKYVNKLVSKGLLDKFRSSANKKNIILKISDLGHEEYKKYSEFVYHNNFAELFQKLDSLPQEHIDAFLEIIKLWGSWHISLIEQDSEEKPIELEKIT